MKITQVEYRPLGIHYNTEEAKKSRVAPLIVESFTHNSYGEQQLEIKKGWRLVRINDVDCAGHRNFAEVVELIKKEMAPLPPWPLQLVVEVGGEHETYKIDEEPLGLNLSHDPPPIRITSVEPGSGAEKKGVKEGIISKIGMQDVKHHHKQKILDMLKEETHHFSEDNHTSNEKHHSKL